MTERQKRKQAKLLAKKKKMEKARREREEARRQEEERKRAQAEDRRKAYVADVAALEERKALIADMIAVGDYEAARAEIVEIAVGGCMSWAGPLAVAGIALGLPLAAEVSALVSENAAEVGAFSGLALAAYAARKWYKKNHPTIEELEEMLDDYDDYDEIDCDEIEAPRVASRVAPMPATPRTQPDVTVMDRFRESKVPHFLIAGATGAGKTTLVKHLIKERARQGHKILICDPHNVQGAWGEHKVRAGGADFEAYSETLEGLHKHMMTTLKRLSNGKMQEDDIQLMTVYLGEWSWTYQELGKKAAKTLMSLVMGCRKTGIRLIIDAQSSLVESLGIRGQGDLRESLGMIKLFLSSSGEHLVYFNGEEVRSLGPFQGWAVSSGSSVQQRSISSGSSDQQPSVSSGSSVQQRSISSGSSDQQRPVSSGSSVQQLSVSSGGSEEAEELTEEAEEPAEEKLAEETEEELAEELTEEQAELIVQCVIDGMSNSATMKKVWGSNGGRNYKTRMSMIKQTRMLVKAVNDGRAS